MNTRDKLKFGFGGGITMFAMVLLGVAVALELPLGWYAVAVGLLFMGGLVLFTEFTKGSIALVGMILLVGCGAANAGQPKWFHEQEALSDKIAISGIKAVPYPLSTVQRGGFLERKNQVEKLKRFSDQNKIGYLYIMSFGKFVGYYTIKGKVSSVNSQLTNVNQTWNCGSACTAIVDSIGDDGSFGPNEGGDAGVFFFTQQGTMVVTVLEWLYSDQALSINVPNLIK